MLDVTQAITCVPHGIYAYVWVPIHVSNIYTSYFHHWIWIQQDVLEWLTIPAMGQNTQIKDKVHGLRISRNTHKGALIWSFPWKTCPEIFHFIFISFTISSVFSLSKIFFHTPTLFFLLKKFLAVKNFHDGRSGATESLKMGKKWFRCKIWVIPLQTKWLPIASVKFKVI